MIILTFYIFLGAIFLAIFVKILKSLYVNIRGYTIVISGCDSGFGHSLAKRLSLSGLTVIAGCLDIDSDGAKALQSHSSFIHVLPLDVTKDDSVLKFKQSSAEIISSTKGLWALINNAGIAISGDIEFTPMSEYEKIFQVNTLGAVRLTKAFLPQLRAQCGRVISMASIMSHTGMPCLSGYCMSKAALLSFSDALRFEMLKFGILSISVEPYFFKTGIVSAERSLQVQQEYLSQVSPSILSHYPPAFMEAYLNSFTFGEEEAINDITPVLDGLVHAISSRYPYRHYRMNWRSTLWMFLAHYLPDGIIEMLVSIRMPFIKKFDLKISNEKKSSYFL